MAEVGRQPDESEQDNLAQRESEANGFNYSPSKAEKRERAWDVRTAILSKMAGRKRRWIIGGAFGAAFIAGIIALFLSLLPLRVLNVVSNLQNHFYASAESATQKEANVLFSNYLKNYVLPAAKNCPKRIDKSCNPIPANNNPVNRLYKGWRNARLEDRIAKNYGLEFGFDTRNGGHYYMKSVLTGSNQVNLDEFRKSSLTLDEFLEKNGDQTLKKSSRAEIRLAVNKSLENETLWKRMMYKYKIGTLLEEKYGIKRCITKLGCKLTDKVQDTIAVPKKAAQAYVAERVLQPRSQILADVFTCLYVDPNCDPVNSTSAQPCSEGANCASNGEAESDSERAIRTKLDSLVASFAGDDAYKIFKEISDSGSLGQYMVKQVISKVFNTGTGEATSKALPVIGWINLADQIVIKGRDIGPEVQKLTYVTNSASMVHLWSTYRTYADEIKSGNVSAEEVGSFTDSLNRSTDASKGGTAAAEDTPLYQNMLGGGTGSSSSVSVLNPFSSKTYAATKPPFLCDSGKPPAKLICPEEGLTSGNGVTTAISDFFNSPYMAPIIKIAQVWHDSVGKIFGLFSKLASVVLNQLLVKPLDAACTLPPWVPNPAASYCAIKDYALGKADQLMNAAVNFIIPNPFSENMSGGRTFDLMAGGADVSGNDYAHNGLGGRALSDQDVAIIRNEQDKQRQLEYQNQPLVARLFDKNSEDSFVTKVAMAMPSSFTDAKSGLASLFNPKHFANLFLPLLHLNRVTAAASSADPFGVQQYGYTDADIQAIGDPEKYWDAHCADNPSQGYQNNQDFMHQGWNQAAANLSKSNAAGSYMPKNIETNPCILIKAVTGSVGGKYDDELLTKDDLRDLPNGGGGAASCDSPGFAPYDPGEWNKIPGNIQAAIEANADKRTSTECGAYANAHPSDPTKQFMGEWHYVDPFKPEACDGQDLGPFGGNKWPGQMCIGIKYRDPPVGQNTKVIPIGGGGSGSSGSSSSGSTSQPSGGVKGAQ
jgi:hypothetical protein